MRTVVVADYAALSHLAAGIVAGFIWAHPRAVLGLPTGSTPEGFYRALVATGVSFREVRTFNLDEYVGLPRECPQSYYMYMKTRLYDHVDLRPENAHIPDGLASDPEEECRRYEAAIRRAGGLDLVVLGLGHNGHIGFNEPGTPWDIRTHRVTLAESTRRANARFFGSVEAVPREAITMGIGTILEARRILVLVSGEDKAEIVKRFLEGSPSVSVPATALRQHPDVTVIVDRAAASRLASSAGKGAEQP
ncbi:MAG TPA: glucosamine-6-phosphate deaminase [Symbiobacteriaceae bacterium]